MYKPKDIVLAPFRYSDRDFYKIRPAVIATSERYNVTHNHVIAVMITSAQDSQWPSDILITPDGGNGLEKPCYLRLKLNSFDVAVINRKIGVLSDGVYERLKAGFTDALLP
ncbi:MAG: type II toxin-antitoxin system PemK/MazF family toxin [Bdellovibrionales bacterium]